MAEVWEQLKKTLTDISLSRILSALLLLVICIVVVYFVMRAVKRILNRSSLDHTVIAFILPIVRFVLYFLVLLLIASYLKIDVTSLVALLSVVSLAVSLAVQSVLSNVAGGFMVISTKPFKQGDFVQVGDIMGTIDQVGLIYTILETPQNCKVMIPNSQVATATVQNFTTLGRRRLDMVFSASYEFDPEVVKDALQTAAHRCNCLPEPPTVQVMEYGDSAISYLVWVWVEANDYLDCKYRLNDLVWTIFKERGIEMTYPHLNVHLDTPENKPKG